MSTLANAELQEDDTIFQPWHQRTVITHACVVLPTYNEAANIKHTLNLVMMHHDLHRNLRRQFNMNQVTLSVLVVDDSSPDGTASIVSEYSKECKNVHLLVREGKSGLGAAYIAGMKHALDTLDPDIIIEMDADGQHNPADIFRLIQGIEDGADFAIGSRYVTGGKIPSSWKLHRRLISRSANIYTKAILNTAGTNDCTGGFRAIRSSLLSRIDFSKLQTKGYAFQVTLLDAAVLKGAKVVEIPIEFHERTKGESKMSAKDIIAGGLSLAKIRVRRLLPSHSPRVTYQTTLASRSGRLGNHRYGRGGAS